ncbi:MAG: DUF697 domain-containing protein [Candidatus Eisenbacteria bacterium]|uniref:DUF697 domain-containing protein n=1 Tax=Eiseniibacteriota bacterium TaxID=2212470 RepID=A0A956LZ72_UNCEI|nr:DUF697 domain-containing protein [Candidatus Eisenbacteria bacterium]
MKRILIPIGIGLGIFALVGVVGSALVVFQEASRIHPILGWTVLGLLALGFFLLVILPVSRVLALPGALVAPKERTGTDWARYLQRYADRLLSNRHVKEGYGGIDALRQTRDAARGKTPTSNDLDALLTQIEATTRHLDKIANQKIVQHAAAVFVVTGASQSGRFDTGIVFSTQIRMVKELAELYYQRPGPRELWQLYANVGGSAFLAGEIQDSELLAVLGAPVSAALSGFVPVSGTAPLISLMVHSLLDGSANALLTLRVGILARRYCGVAVGSSRREVARSASIEAAGLLAGVVAQGARRIASATRRLVVQGAVQGPQTAVRGVTDMGTTVVQEISRLAGRVGDKAWRASQSAFRGISRIAGEGGTANPSRSGLESSGVGTAVEGSRTIPVDPVDPQSTRSRADNVADLAGEMPTDPAIARDTLRFWERVAEFFGA